MKLESCDRCGRQEELDSKNTSDWTDVEYKGRESTVVHIRKATYCPSCSRSLKEEMSHFNTVCKQVPHSSFP